jgi:signal peptidase I
MSKTHRNARAAGAGHETAETKKGGRVKTERSPRRVAWEWLKAIIWALAVALLIRQFLFQAFRIPTGSMKDTLLVHDFLFVNKFIYGAKTPDRLTIPFLNATLAESVPYLKLPAVREPQQGDIIVFELPQDRSQDYIKRCVAVAGDTVQVSDGILRVNGMVYESNFADRDGDHSCIPYWRERDNCPEPRSRLDPASMIRGPFNREFGPVVVEDGHLFMMGDNRYNSMDSRYWGQLPLELVKGKAEIIYWSYDRVFFWPRWERLLQLIDLPPGRGWLQHLVRLVVIGLIGWSIWHYRRRDRRKAAEAGDGP